MRRRGVVVGLLIALPVRGIALVLRSEEASASSSANATSSPLVNSTKQRSSFWTFSRVPELTLPFPLDGSVAPPNWVGPSIRAFSDSACYRKTYEQNAHGECPRGYNPRGHKCWAQCPLSYPVQCFTECLPQNDDCTLEVVTKIANPGYVLLNLATAGLLSVLYKSYASITKEVVCAFNLFNIAEGISRFLQFRQLTTPNGTKEELLSKVYQTDLFLVDLPIAIAACMGYTVPRYAYFADAVVTAAETLVKQLIMNHNLILSSVDAFVAFFRNTTLGNATRELDAESIANLTSMINSGTSCGFELKRLTDRVIAKIADFRDEQPSVTPQDLRIKMSHSSIVLTDIPVTTNKCMGELLKVKKPYVAYQTRDALRKTFGVMIDQLIDMARTDMGQVRSRRDYLTATANMGLLVLSALDPTGIAFTAYNYVQPVCGPTEFIGEIDDGSLTDALGLVTKDTAFHGTDGTWTKKGDGNVVITFISADTKNVRVVVRSGGKKVAVVYVNAGATVVWQTTVKALEEKTMYLERWRPGLLGLKGSGGGSLMLWVPRSSEGGHLEMTARLNVS
ncbi:hypothetical protein PsorP6_006531 [Peronosclerospora sorghi]|uniref:Uncharacterized protein n=1 Tax=Peronosclerospora sorghi TaxID=230839 RepID=A0ACC0W1W8_9STRA|nr:hypothetical protein PsorP6_006531 [Peronosclerospora sorghi]